MAPGLLQVFFELWNLHGTSNYVLYWNHNEDENNSLKNINDKNQQANSVFF